MSDPMDAPTVRALLFQSIEHLKAEHPELVHLIELVQKDIDILKARDAVHLAVIRQASILLTSLYDVSEATDPEELQAWLTERLTGPDGPFTKNPYPDNIADLRAAIKDAQYLA